MRENALNALQFLRGGAAMLVTALLIVEIGLFYGAPTAENIPHPPPLISFQQDIGNWKMLQQSQVDAETQSYLKADDTLTRLYRGPAGPVTLFVAFFKSQRSGVTPHSPKICLPGAGWTPEESRIISVSVPAADREIPVNRYVVRHGGDRSLVLYWYSTAHYVVANEYVSKLYLMYEGLRYRRSDEAVYRVIVPITSGDAAAEAEAIGFIQSFYAPLRRQIWASI